MTHYQESPLHKYAFNEFLDDQNNPVFIGGYPINNLILGNDRQLQQQQGGSNTLGGERLNHLSVPVGLVMDDYSHMANLHGGKYSKVMSEDHDKDQDKGKDKDQDQDNKVRLEDDKNHDPIDDDLFKKLFGKVERPKVERPKVEEPNREKKYTIKDQGKRMSPNKREKTKTKKNKSNSK